MMKILAAMVVTVSSCLTMAGEILPAEARQKGINEVVTIQSLGTNWGYTQKMNGFYIGTARYDLVPVTREAAQVIQSLNKQSRYNCIIENSTYVAQEKVDETAGGTYFVLDINCN